MKKFLYILLCAIFVASCSVDQLDAGLEGPQGIQGEQGIPGQDGQDGQDGADGASAYEIAVANGFEGTVADWLNSLIGATGADGADGQDGQDGADGSNGTNGTNGIDGASAYELAVEAGFEGTLSEWLLSLVGETGAQGEQGANGPRGPQGENGDIGPVGPQGPQGDTPIYSGDIIEFVSMPCDDSREILMKVTHPDDSISFYGVYYDKAAKLAFWTELNQSSTYVTTDGSDCVFTFINGDIVGGSYNGNNNKITVCHDPSGQNRQTKHLNLNALRGHLNHGDTIGACVN